MEQMAFLAGMITGIVTTFIISAWAIWVPMVREWKTKHDVERDRRIEAEDAAQAQLDDDVRIIGEWPPPMDLFGDDQ